MTDQKTRKEILQEKIAELEAMIDDLDEKSDTIRAELKGQREELNKMKAELANIEPRLN